MSFIAKYSKENGQVKRTVTDDENEDFLIEESVGPITKNEIHRINNFQFADITYEFDLDAGMYKEISRVVYDEDKEPDTATQISQLQATVKEQADKITAQDEQIAQMSTDLAVLQEMILFPE